MNKHIKRFFKYENRETGDPVYFTKHGDDYFRRDKNFKKFKFIGMLSEAEKEKEEADRLEKANNVKETEENEALELELSESKSKAKSRPLGEEETQKLLDKRSKKLKKKSAEEEEEEEELREGAKDLSPEKPQLED